MGLEARFIEPVITALQAMVNAIRYGFPTHHYGYGQASSQHQTAHHGSDS